MNKDRIILFFAVLIYTCSAFFNNGFYHYDEHYQIIEFTQLKLSATSSDQLAWEYGAKIRPSFQPTLLYVFISIMKIIDIRDSYYIMVILRLITTAMALTIITYYIKNTIRFVDSNLRFYYKFLAYFLWFLPFINIRFSSETYSGLMFLLSIAVYYSNIKFKYLVIGILFGLSFLFRFQMGFMSLGFIFWILFQEKATSKQIFILFIGISSIVLIGLLIDFWFYGGVTLTSYNYLITVITNHDGPTFDESPWYFYFTASSSMMIFPLGYVIWILVLIYFVIHFRSLHTWIIVPFLIIHILIPHKEIRFLFPIVNFLPFIIVIGYQTLIKLSTSLRCRLVGFQLLLIIIAAINLVALTVNVLSPADDEGRTTITQTVHRKYKNKKTVIWRVDCIDPYKPISLGQSFYYDVNVQVKTVTDTMQITYMKDVINLLVYKGADIQYYETFFNCKLHLIQSGMPNWIVEMKKYAGYNHFPIVLYEMIPNTSGIR